MASNKDNGEVSEKRPDVSKVASALIISACEKAGMQGIDRSRIDAIILRESGNSAYMQQQRKRDEQVDVRIEKMINELNKKNDASGGRSWKESMERELEDEVNANIRNRPSRSSCCVVDMDMFYMGCELLTRPELSNKPCCVGGGLVTTSNYVARRYGVRSAMAGFIADKLVEELSGGKEKLIHLPLNFALYTEKALQVREVLKEYDPNLKAYSLDEACLDIGSYLYHRLEGRSHAVIVNMRNQVSQPNETAPEGAVETANHTDEGVAQYPSHVALRAAADVLQEMRNRVHQATGGLTCSAGLAPNFMLAKIASDRNKPNGQLLIGPSHEEVVAFLHPLPTRKVCGIGRVTEKMLCSLGVYTVGDLYHQRASVRLCFTPATAKFLLSAAIGCSSYESKDDDVDDSIGRKGISRERTFEDGRPWSEVIEKLESIARKLGEDMRSKALWARTLTLKVKLHTFDVISRARTLPRGRYAQHPDELIQIASELLHDVRRQFKGVLFSVRLLGIRCSNFQEEHERCESMQMNIKRYLSTCTDLAAHVGSTHSIDARNQLEIAAGSFDANVDFDCRDQMKPPLREKEQPVRKAVGCPMCGKVFDVNDNVGLNVHIDECLNGPTVQAAAREETFLAKPRKKFRLTDFFAGS